MLFGWDNQRVVQLEFLQPGKSAVICKIKIMRFKYKLFFCFIEPVDGGVKFC